MTTLVELLFGAYRRRVLGLLLRVEEGLHVREISRLTGVPAGSLHRELRALTTAGLLVREPSGNQVRYRANRASPIFPELAEIFRKTADPAGQSSPAAERGDAGLSLHSPVGRYATVPRAAARPPTVRLRVSQSKLQALCRKYGIAKVSLFGSAARDELKPESDVDLLVEFLPESRTSLFDIEDLKEELSAAFEGRRVDVATPEIMRNPFRRESILADLRPIYVARRA